MELNAGKRNGKLVEVQDGRGYRIARLTHSHGWLLPETYQLLKDMGNDFADALEGTASEGAVFRVTGAHHVAQALIPAKVHEKRQALGPAFLGFSEMLQR